MLKTHHGLPATGQRKKWVLLAAGLLLAGVVVLLVLLRVPTGTTSRQEAPAGEATTTAASSASESSNDPAYTISALELSPEQAHLTAAQAVAAPLQPLTLTLQLADYSGAAELRLYDAQRALVEQTTLQVVDGQASVAVLPRGAPGAQTALVFVDTHLVIAQEHLFTLEAQTTVQSGITEIDRIYPMVRDFMAGAMVEYDLEGQPVRGYRSPDNPLIWLRDHVYQGRGFRYFEPDVTSTLAAFRRAQDPDGSLPDVLTHPALHVEAHRLDTTADVESLFVQGVYEAWQMSGDDALLQENLEAMRRALGYLTSDPLRWNSDLGLVQRPYTIDTWDFEYGASVIGPNGQPSPRHWIDEQTIWGIFHGDNTALAYAMKLMERMEQHLGNAAEARQWEQQRVALMQRLVAHSWNGHFFTHFVPLDETTVISPPVDTAAQLSLSNAYALNREVIDSFKGRAIVQSYFDRRDFERAFAEWYSIDPPFPAGSYGMGGLKGEQPGEYVNGGIMPLTGGELARGAFRYGFEDYGFDILLRYSDLIHLTGASYLWYYPDGRPGISGPHTLATDGWGSSAMLGALMEGAAGIGDTQSRYQEVDVAPRWTALPQARDVRVVARYAASDGYVAYHWQRAEQRISLELTGTWQRARVRLLLPEDAPKKRHLALQVNGEQREVVLKKEAGSRYIEVAAEGGNASVVLAWE